MGSATGWLALLHSSEEADVDAVVNLGFCLGPQAEAAAKATCQAHLNDRWAGAEPEAGEPPQLEWRPQTTALQATPSPSSADEIQVADVDDGFSSVFEWYTVREVRVRETSEGDEE